MDKHTFKIADCPDCGHAVTSAMFIGPCTVKCHNCNAECYARIDLISERQRRQEEAEYEAKMKHSDMYYEEMQADVHINLAKDSNNYGDPDYLPF
jgi:hypothetical protein